MNQEGSDSSDDTMQLAAAKAISALQGLDAAIVLTLHALAVAPPSAEFPPHKSRRQLAYPGTDRAAIRQMWLIESCSYSEVWLDEAGEIWYVSTRTPRYDQPINLALEDEGAARVCTTLVVSFMARLSP